MNFAFYQVKSDYCDFLRKNDRCVPYTMDEKNTRPFVGIVFSVNGYNYYAPLSSPKPKHTHMKNQVDFLKINGGIWGAINFNNMIPVHNESLQKVDMKIQTTDTESDIAYKNLLSNQISWCNAKKAAILSQAEKLYSIITQGKGHGTLVARCCNFAVDEAQFKIYCEMHKLSIDAPECKVATTDVTMKERFTQAQVEADRRNSSQVIQHSQHKEPTR